ncbi:hypothetical protein NIES25_48400 [Nostoc linckia NIES-25]|nr:hypothetical protein NIES25_48400 [Nostoc linckia NIES-25]
MNEKRPPLWNDKGDRKFLVLKDLQAFSIFALVKFVLPTFLKICINYFPSKFSTATHAIKNSLGVRVPVLPLQKVKQVYFYFLKSALSLKFSLYNVLLE